MNEPVVKPTIQYEDFAKLDLRIGTIVEAKLHPDADKLLILQVKVGEETRQIVAGIKQHYEPEKLVNTQIIVVANLAPRKMRGEISSGMLLAATDSKGLLALIKPDKEFESGSTVG